MTWFSRIFKYNPDQPRHPAGSPEGGQWVPMEGAVAGPFDPEKHAERARQLAVANPATREMVGTAPLNAQAPLPFKDTQQAYRNPDGTYTEERAKLHAQIVERLLRGAVPGHSDPQVLFMGGGTAAGKSTIIRNGFVTPPAGAVHLDADAVKAMLPEFKYMTYQSGDIERAAAYVHEESADVIVQAQAAALKDRYHVVVDGVADSGIEKLADKVSKFTRAGYTATAMYATVPTDVAVARSHQRALEEQRYVPEDVIRSNHAGVSKAYPAAVDRALFSETVLYDTNQPKGTPPTLIARSRGSHLIIADQKRWQAFLAKGSPQVQKADGQPVVMLDADIAHRVYVDAALKRPVSSSYTPEQRELRRRIDAELAKLPPGVKLIIPKD